MALTDDEYEMIDAFLDNEMPRDDRDMFEKRVAHDPQIRAALDETRRDRRTRDGVWMAGEPTDAAVSSLLVNIRAAVKKEQVRETLTGGVQVAAAVANPQDKRWLTPYRILRYATSAAACLAVGFFVGQSRQVAPGQNAGIIVPTNQLTGSMVGESSSPGTLRYKVQLVDSTGHVVGTQSFSSLNDAKEFSEDVSRWQRQQQQQQPASGGETVLIKGEF